MAMIKIIIELLLFCTHVMCVTPYSSTVFSIQVQINLN